MSLLPLSDIVVLELGGLAPVPYAGMILADFGAKVIRVDRPGQGSSDVLVRNKRSVALDLKKPAALRALRQMIKKADVLLDPFRPGVLEKLGLDPQFLLEDNPRLIVARISGFGQKGSASAAAGHDINYLATAGILQMIGREGEAPIPPLNVLADFAGGGLICVMGILMSLIERERSGKGQIIDANLTSGSSYLSTFPFLMQKFGLDFADKRGTNLLDGGAPFYRVYKTKDGRYMSVGALEPQFYAQLLKGMGLDPDRLPDQHDRNQWPAMSKLFAEVFVTKTQAEWTHLFDGVDACCAPVLSFREPIPGASPVIDPAKQWPRQALPPQPAPILSRTPAREVDYDSAIPILTPGEHTAEVLEQFGLTKDEVSALISSGAAFKAKL
ncbi:alpha-methylacyl-CoA racemase [Dichotomocladium elegans]|nr:alpha-methylacyl-CoA racemase [Dichotomocladium elegans]